MPFDLHGKYFFLTWPKCELHPDYALAFLQNIRHTLQWAKVVQEHHEDGSFHLHAVCGFSKRIRVRDETFFDLHFGDDCFHGNYQVCRSVKDALAYVSKEDGLCATFGTPPSSAEGGAYAQALQSAKSAVEFKSTLLELAPRDAVLYAGAISTFAEQHFGGTGSGFGPVRDPSSFTVPLELSNWTSNLDGRERPISLILIGPSRLGKTEWARSLGRHLYFNGQFDLGQISGTDLSDVRYAVFDDFPWDVMKRFYKQWFGAQHTFTLTDKYKGKRTIVWGKPIIWLCNPDDFDTRPIVSDWMSQNTVTVNIVNKLF